MTFDEWWDSAHEHPGSDEYANFRHAARVAFDAATRLERERCAALVRGFVTDQPGVGVSYWGEALAKRIMEG